jgi:hypothetical protein
MGKNWPATIFLLAATSLACGQSTQSAGTGVIAGTVLNEEGQLVDHSQVCTQITSGSKTEIGCPVFTDKDGRFQIENAKFGTYAVFAIKEDDGYSIENQDAREQKITITPDAPWANVTIQLKPKGGILIGSVKDKASGHPVKEIQAHYMVISGTGAGGGGAAYHRNGEFRLIVPTACDLVVAVSAPGYKGWVYTDPSNPSRPVLRMSSGEWKELDIELEPLPNPSGQRGAGDSQNAEQPR